MKYLFILIGFLMVYSSYAQDRGTGKPVVASQAQDAENLPVGTQKRRLALVMGMSEYQFVTRLTNPTNDADDIAVELTKAGFSVTKVNNRNLRQAKATINAFVNSLGPKDVVIFYFAGHGIGYLNDNYLLPIDVPGECLDQIPGSSLSVNQIISDIQSKEVDNSFIFLDACRSLGDLYTCPDGQKDAAKKQGFIVYSEKQPVGNIIIYATQAGMSADDNVLSRNGLFTQELLKHLLTPNLTFGQILTITGKGVVLESKKLGKHQEPKIYGLLGLDFVFVSKSVPDSTEKIRSSNQALKAEVLTLKEQSMKSDLLKDKKSMKVYNYKIIISSTVCLSSTVGSLLIYKHWKQNLNNYKQALLIADPYGTGQVSELEEYNKVNSSYELAIKSKSYQGIYISTITLAATSLLFGTYTHINRSKKLSSRYLSYSLGTDGFSIVYKF